MVCKRRRGNKFTPAANGGSWVRPDKRLGIHLRDGLSCTYCAKSIEDGVSLQLDHYIRPEDEGSNHESNLVTACAFCNNSKNNKTIRQWFAVLRSRGYDTNSIGRRARRLMSTDLSPFRAKAKAIIAERADQKLRLLEAG